jgi:hypothetical protein
MSATPSIRADGDNGWPTAKYGRQHRVMEVLDYGEESVSVAMEEINSSNWAKQVYQADIKAKWNTLYKKPGYEM